MKMKVKDKMKTALVAQEIAIDKHLGSNSSEIRKQGIIGVKKWLKRVSNIGDKAPVTVEDYRRIWIGLFYYFWMSDKPLVQEAAAERISSLIHSASSVESAMGFVKGFFSVLTKNFDSISSHRTEKFLMLVRRFFRQSLFWLKYKEWNTEASKAFGNEIYEAQQILSFTLLTHLNNIFIEEVSKVSGGSLPTEALVNILEGYIRCIADLKPNKKSVSDIQNNVFIVLCKQYKEHLRKEGVPKTSGQDIKNSKNDDKKQSESSNVENGTERSENESNTQITDEIVFDPRAGQTRIYIPCIQFDERVFVERLTHYENMSTTLHKAKNIIRQIISMMGSISKLKNPSVKSKGEKRKLSLTEGSVIKEFEERNKKKKGKMPKEHSVEELKNIVSTMGDLMRVKKGKKTEIILNKPERTKPSSAESDKTSSHLSTEDTDETSETESSAKGSLSKGQSSTIEVTNVDAEKSAELTTESSPKKESVNEDSSDSKSKDSNLTVENASSGSSEIRDGSAQIKQKTVTFKEMPEVFSIAEMSVESAETNEIIVPESVAKNLKNTLNPNRNYVVLNFLKPCTGIQSSAVSDNNVEQDNSVVLTASHKEWKSVSLSCLSELLRKRTVEQKNGASKAKCVVQSTQAEKVGTEKKPDEESVETKSCININNKKRKVQFSGENGSQGVADYKASIKTKPKVPFDAAKEPTKGVLKSSTITTPINPFYKMKSKFILQDDNKHKKKKKKPKKKSKKAENMKKRKQKAGARSSK